MKILTKSISMLLVIAMLAMTVCSCATTPLDRDTALRELEQRVNQIKPISVEVDINDDLDDGESYLPSTQVLPNLTEYPFVVDATTPNYIIVYSDNHSVIQAANDFNRAAVMVDGQPISVSVRAIDSVTGIDLVLANRFMPDLIILKNELYGEILEQSNIPTPIQLIADQTIRDLSGVIVSNEGARKNNISSFSDLVRSVQSGELKIGYVDPSRSADGLNFILAVLHEHDPMSPMSEAAVDGLRQLYRNIKTKASDEAQLKGALRRSTIDGFVTDYNTFQNESDYRTGYQFIPCGIQQNHPAYAVGQLTPQKMQIARAFVQYCQAQANTDSVVDNYKSDISSGSIKARELIDVYQLIRGGTSDTAIAFVIDKSGSMLGSPMRQLQAALQAANDAIPDGIAIGQIEFNNKVYITAPLAVNDRTQRLCRSNAITKMVANGGTATWDAVAVAISMLTEYEEEHPGANLVVILLTDGNRNRGLTLDQVLPTISALDVATHVFAYESETEGIDIEPLQKFASASEGRCVNAEDVKSQELARFLVELSKSSLG